MLEILFNLRVEFRDGHTDEDKMPIRNMRNIYRAISDICRIMPISASMCIGKYIRMIYQVLQYNQNIIKVGGRQYLPRMEVPPPWKLPWARFRVVIGPLSCPALWGGQAKSREGKEIILAGGAWGRWMKNLEDPAEIFKSSIFKILAFETSGLLESRSQNSIFLVFSFTFTF